MDQAFGNRGVFVFATNQRSAYSSIAEKLGATEILIPLAEVCGGLREVGKSSSEIALVELPRLDGGTVVVPPDRARWVEEELEILHLSIGLAPASQESELRDFLRGLPISWYGLNVRVDVDRSVAQVLERRLLTELASRATRRVNLWHWPGAGGSTVACRVAWDIHKDYPTVVARHIDPASTAARVQYLFGLTRLPIMVLVEAASTSAEDMDRLYDRVRSANVPVVFLQVERRQTRPSQSNDPYLDAMLTTSEAVAIAQRLATEVPNRRGALEQVVDEQDRRRRTPFYFGLVAFGKDFAGLEPYVGNRLTGSSQSVLTVCRLTALAYHFGHQPVPLQLFASVVGLPLSQIASLSNALPEVLQELFVQLPDQLLRPSHELIASEMLEQLLAQGQADRRNWRLALADAANEFIDIAAQHHQHSGGALSSLVRAVTIERGPDDDNRSDPTDEQFSQLISAIPSTEGKLRVLEGLVQCFPHEPHFWAHLGRFFSMATHDHVKAHEAHKEAIALAEDDPLLHHMAGMAWRGEVYDFLDPLIHADLSRDQEAQLQHFVTEAKYEFSASLRLDPRREHSYISQIQMVTRVVGVTTRIKGFGQDTASFLIMPENTWYRELVDEAENLLFELSLARTGESTSRLQQDARVRIDNLYGDYSRVIEGCNNLLARSDVYRPPVRRAIVRAYLSRRKQDWSKLNDRELHRISELATENITAEPDSDQNLRLWFRAVRLTRELTIERIAEQLAYRRFRHPTVDTLYYLYILKLLQADAGAGEMAREAQELIGECSQLAASLPNRTKSFEWLGEPRGLVGLLHESALGAWDHSSEFWSNETLLRRVPGHISRIQSPGSGEIELSTGLKAFFVPSRGRVDGGYITSRDIGRSVEFYLGFSYDGLRAWGVGDPEPNSRS